MMKTVKYLLLVLTVLFVWETSFGQNQNLLEPVNKFNGEPYLSVNPNNPQHMVVSWRDRRNSEDSTYTTSSEIWGVYRNKNSTEFSANFPISDESVPYDPIVAEAGNDFMCIKLVNDTLNAVWGDVGTGKMNIWFQRMSPDGNILSNRQISSENIPEIKIIPNPAISNVRIEGKNINNVLIVNLNGEVLHVQKNLNRTDKLDLNSGERIPR